MTQKVEVKLVTDASAAIKSQEALERKVEELSKSYEQAGKVSVKAAKAAVGSFQRLEDELKDNVKQLKRMEVGTAAFAEQKRKVDELTKSLKGAKLQVDGGGNSLSARMGASVKDFATSVVGFASLTGAVMAIAKLMNSELADLRRRDTESRDAVRTREQSIAALVQNAGGELTDKIVERVEALSAITGDNSDAMLSVASSVASAGVADATKIVEIAQLALQSQGGEVGSSTAIAGAAIDLANTLNVSVKEAFGVLFQTAGTARPEDIALLGKAAVRATAALISAGSDAEKAQEIFAASTLLSGDKTGESAVSIANDLSQAFRALQSGGVPKSISVGGIKEDVNIPADMQALLTGPALKNLTLDQLLDMSRGSTEVEKVFESFLPNSQNRAFTQQIVGGSATFDAKLQQAADSIDLATAGAKADQQVADVTGRRPIGALEGQLAGILDQNLQDSTAALRSFAREAFTQVVDRTDTTGPDLIMDAGDRLAATLLTGIRGTGVAGTRAARLENLVQFMPAEKDKQTVQAVATLLDHTQKLIDKSEQGQLTPREVNRELQSLRDTLTLLNLNNAAAQAAAQQQIQLLAQIAANGKPNAGGQPMKVVIANAGPVEAPPAAAGRP